MIDLGTKYLGLELKNPIIAGASRLTAHMDSIKKIEESGAGAMVVKSLFEEEIQLERLKLDQDLEKYCERHPEMISIFPRLEHAGPKEHLMWVRKTKETVSIPVIASLNAVNRDTWVEYAKLLQETGIDALELNLYSVPTDFEKDASALEEEQASIVEAIQQEVTVPVAVKLSPFYSNPLHFVSRLDRLGVKGFVLFNRFFQPDIDINTQKNIFPLNLSLPIDNRLALRFAGLLHGKVEGDICSNTGVFQGEDVVKMILAGATCVQVVSTLFQNGVEHIGKMLQAIEEWMKAKGCDSLEDFRGRLSRRNIADPWVYTRAQYVKFLLNPELLIDDVPLP
jgi:dihydroorotate dehydrogenase (fumarate)